MKCPFCGSQKVRVLDSRPTDDFSAIRRRRECEECSERFTTFERFQSPVLVVKRSGEKDAFDRDKVVRGVKLALKNRPVDEQDIEDLISSIEENVQTLGPIVRSESIGILVLEGLKDLDGVGYMRFASVYKDFAGIEDFEREVKLLEKNTSPKTRAKKDSKSE